MAGVVWLSVQTVVAQLQSDAGVPETVVLVLKLVSSTHVRPTTGLVISNDGMVLVPADFVSAGDEIVILQGGTDIIRNGRPSRTVKRSVTDGLAVLSVQGLDRPAIVLSEDRLLQDHVYHLAAFPAADKMAEGADPLWMPVRLTKSNSTGGFVISTDTPLPDTTGPIIDDCGYLVGLNLAESETPVVVLGDELSVIFDSMQIKLQSSACRTTTQTGLTSQETAKAEPADPAGQAIAEEVSNRISGSTVNAVVPQPPTALKPASIFSLVPAWLWMIGGAILIALLARLLFFLRLNKPGLAPIGVEPDSGKLQTGSRASSTRKAKTPEVHDGTLVIEGTLADDTPFRQTRRVNTKQIDVVIGSGDTDIRIETPAVGRRHLRLKSVGESLTLSDLGSGKGTFIRDIPCLPKEIMLIGSADEILLGDVRICISVQTGSIQAGSLPTTNGDSK